MIPRRLARALIVAPHPDDETIGCFGLVRRLRRQGTRVRLLIVTDGGASHPGSARWPRRRLAAARAAETRRAARRMGLTAADCRFLGLADGALAADPAAARRIAAAAARWGARLVVGPCAGDDHADHRATARHLAAARLPGARRLAYRVWPQGTRRRDARALVLASRERLAKRATLRGYRTQCGAITDDPSGFAMTPRQIAGFTGPREWFARA